MRASRRLRIETQWHGRPSLARRCLLSLAERKQGVMAKAEELQRPPRAHAQSAIFKAISRANAVKPALIRGRIVTFSRDQRAKAPCSRGTCGREGLRIKPTSTGFTCASG